ncbi:MAG: hypothetical protein ACRCTY_07255 [Candidatus Adiutrix sp.]
MGAGLGGFYLRQGPHIKHHQKFKNQLGIFPSKNSARLGQLKINEGIES